MTGLRTEPVPAGGSGAPGKGSGGAPGRAGRNLPAAISVGVAIAAAVLLTLYTARVLFVGVVVLAVGLGLHELVAAVRLRGVRLPAPLLIAGGMLTPVLTWPYGARGLAGGAFATVVVTVLWRGVARRTDWLRDGVVGTLLTLYVPVLAGCVVLLARPDDGADRVVAFAATTVCSDVGAYAAGVLFGRHFLAPTISPKKTWEGFAGSLAACVVAGVALLGGFFAADWWQGVVFGLAVAVAATAGDLGESFLKRRLGVKDMGALLPGHGGVMDRADSLLPAALVALLLLLAFTPPT